MRRVTVRIYRRIVLVNFKQVNLVLVLIVLEDVEAQAARLIVVGATRVAQHGRHELVFESGFDVDFDNQGNHR